MLFVVGSGDVGSCGPQLCGDDLQTFALQAANDLTDQSALNTIGLYKDESSVHGADASRVASHPTP